MNDLTITAHLGADTRTRVVSFPDTGADRGGRFVTLRIGGGPVDIALIAIPGTADVLRAIATAATEAARELDGMTASPEVSA
ncbi:hypothetical protein ABT009_26550 [Streptomyces sp. NPDC002896]|uniref:hypothetical protein n=1 Tax=Streptomyces sp. NPDC002896 TaxID=3154438 RepID=UPI00331C1DA4